MTEQPSIPPIISRPVPPLAPPARARRRIRLHWIVLVLLAIHVLCVLVIDTPSLRDAGGAYRWGFILGRSAGPLLIGMLFGIVAFWIARRSNLVFNIVVCAFLGLALLGDGLILVGSQLRQRQPGTVANATAMEALDAIGAESNALREQQRAEFEAKGYVELDETAARERLASLKSRAEAMPGDAGEGARASMRVMEPMTDLTLGYQRTVQEFMAAGGLNLEPTPTREILDARLACLTNMTAANEAIIVFLQRMPENARVELSTTGLSPQRLDAVANQLLAAVKHPEMMELRASQTDFIAAASDQLTLLRDNLGRWTFGADGLVTFEDDAPLPAFNRSVERLQKAIDREQAVTTTLLGG